MTQADSVHSTPPINTSAISERIGRDAKSYREMDSDLCDVINMGKIAAILTCGDHPARPEDQATLTAFAVCQTERMLKRFKEKYDGNEWAVEDGQEMKSR